MADLWPGVVRAALSLDRQVAVGALVAEAEARRVHSDYNTGSITAFEAGLLWALADATHARTVVEVGTFIGTSTVALSRGADVRDVYTCDSSNDCLPATDVLHPYPRWTSTEMFHHLVKIGVQADLCFFDGVLRRDDVRLLQAITHAGTVCAVHDYNHGPKIRRHGSREWTEIVPRKGIGNIDLLRTWVKGHRLVPPEPETTLAVLLP